MKLLKKKFLKRREADNRFMIYLPPDITDDDHLLTKVYQQDSRLIIIVGEGKKVKIEEVEDESGHTNITVY